MWGLITTAILFILSLNPWEDNGESNNLKFSSTQTERIAQQAGVTIQQIIPKVIVAVMVITAMGQKERKNLIKF